MTRDDERNERVETFPCGRVWVDEALGILRVTFEPEVTIYLAEAQAQVAAMQRLTAGTPMPCLVDMTEIRKTDRAAREYYAGPETRKAASACAMMIGSSGIGAVIGNFMLALYGDRLMPLKLFTREDDAVAWLVGFVERPARPR